MKKLSQQQLKFLIDKGIMQKHEAEELIEEGNASASTRAGKMKYANEEIQKAYDNLMNTIELNLTDWNEKLAENHLPTIESTKKITLNIKK